jgi:hypothetical protein
MTDSLTKLREEFHRVAENAQLMAFMPRAVEVQQQACDDIEQFLEKLSDEKRERAAGSDEVEANTILAMELSLQAVLNELRMYLELKNDRGDAAWDHLVSAQGSAEMALGVRRQMKLELGGLEMYGNKLALLEELLFPPQVFMSVGGTAVRTQCSICGESYDDCGHIKGRAYMGVMCSRIVQEMDLCEVSLVTNPANKHCRVTHFSDEGRMRNRLTWSFEEPNGANTENDV